MLVVMAHGSLAAAGEPATTKKTLVPARSLLAAMTKAVGTVDTKFVAMTLVEEQIEKAGEFLAGPPVACFGLRKLGDKLAYTYFILFRGEVKGKRLKINFDVPSSVGGHEADVKPFIEIGDRKIPIEYQFKADPKTGDLLHESLKVDGKNYDKAGSRVFLVDLTQPKIAVQAVKVNLPDQVPDGADDKEFSTKVTRALQQLQEKSTEVKTFLNLKHPPHPASAKESYDANSMPVRGTSGHGCPFRLQSRDHARPVETECNR